MKVLAPNRLCCQVTILASNFVCLSKKKVTVYSINKNSFCYNLFCAYIAVAVKTMNLQIEPDKVIIFNLVTKFDLILIEHSSCSKG